MTSIAMVVNEGFDDDTCACGGHTKLFIDSCDIR